ncbi:DnaJ-class molecular chaperone with C-terminal Zn finger domain [Synechococcus sp. PCC 7502]|uniref:J domain-containing protein n=1 Tax=Synechococcus sp. PCC 7502 TaxID=1173263 RepID=UPI00029FE7E9|nr:DnaJ domain-containing protein [Synechococcus sp. PCC 7502]AFY75155.1 DnaJ-class molecular chaperone with C-terminal Zn finger domain [Synechococcus sp. PCC 7502]
MQQSECYRLLGLSRGASLEDIKLSYRRLARKYHPDVNQDDPAAADKFRLVQQAYQILKDVQLGIIPPQAANFSQSYHPEPQPTRTPPTPKVKVEVKSEVRSKDVRQKVDPIASDPELRLKLDTLRRLQDLLKQRKYIVAIAIAEGMRGKFPQSPEVIHWQAVTYHRWGNELILKKKYKEAEVFLNKALNTDPSNRELAFEVKRDLDRIAAL